MNRRNLKTLFALLFIGVTNLQARDFKHPGSLLSIHEINTIKNHVANQDSVKLLGQRVIIQVGIT